MYKWAIYTPQITAKLLECYRKKDFSAISWWNEYKNKKKNAEFYHDDLLDLQAFWNHLMSFVHTQPHIDRWNKTIQDLGIAIPSALTVADFPCVHGIDQHGIPSLRRHQYRSCRMNPQIMPKLWELMDIAQAYAIGGRSPVIKEAFVKTFNEILQMTVPVEKPTTVKCENDPEKKANVITQENITPAFISKLLFISFPYVFMTIDGNTKKLYPEIEINDGVSYLGMCDRIKAYLINEKRTNPAMHNVPDNELLIYFSAYAYLLNN